MGSIRVTLNIVLFVIEIFQAFHITISNINFYQFGIFDMHFDLNHPYKFCKNVKYFIILWLINVYYIYM